MTSELQSKLERLGRRLYGGDAKVSDVVRLSGGATLETWAFAVHVNRFKHDYILRRRNAHVGFSIGMDAEAALIQAVTKQGVLAPPLVHLCDDRDELGDAHVTQRVAGETLGRKIVADPKFDAVRPTLARQCGHQLARIHATMRPSSVSLETLDANAVLSRYEHIYRESGAHRPVLELAFQHLRKLAPSSLRPVLLHGDFRNGNLIVDSQSGIAAVLDWELAHQGDPAEDLGWLCVNSWRFGVPQKPVGGFGDYSELLSGYREAGGEDIALSRVRYWQALGSLKWGVMCFMMYRSWAEGKERSVERPLIGRRVSETEIDLLNSFEAGL